LALEVLGFNNFSFERVKIEGRFEVISENPLIIIDGSHNVDSVIKFLNSTLKIVGKDCIFIFGINRDKEYEKIVREIIRVDPAYVIVTNSQSPRALQSEELLEVFLKNGLQREKIESAKSAQQSLEIAMKRGKIILVFGSFYLSGEVKSIVQSVSF